MKKTYFVKTSFLGLDLIANSVNTTEIRPINPQELDSDYDIEITKVIPGTIDEVTTTIKQKKQTDECSNNVSNLQNNYHSENYKLNERIKEGHDRSNDDIQSDTGENIIDIDDHVKVTTSRKVYINERYWNIIKMF